MEQLPGQISFFDDPPEPADPLREIMRLEMSEGAHLRILAALSFPRFACFARDYLIAEYGDCGHSLDGGFVDFRRSGIRHMIYRKGRPPEERVYTWGDALRRVRELIDDGEYLTREEERQMEAIIQARGRLPYPRPFTRYPDCAWDGTPEGYPLRRRP